MPSNKHICACVREALKAMEEEGEASRHLDEARTHYQTLRDKRLSAWKELRNALEDAELGELVMGGGEGWIKPATH